MPEDAVGHLYPLLSHYKMEGAANDTLGKGFWIIYFSES